MAKKTFNLLAAVSTENPDTVKRVLHEILPKGAVTKTEDGFQLKADLTGESARELNRELLSALRRVEKKTRLRAEWKSGNVVERFFDYVPKGSRKV